ncbi:MAG: BamA/TamA family outer membrane protein [Desulfobacca sp.]|nr:BamA/TamA family outer membrane protein [Desulfobacca sp.]
MAHRNLGLPIFLILLMVGFSSCSMKVPAAVVPPPLPVQRTDEKIDTTLFPLPVVATDPNSGNDYGFLPVWIFPRDDKAMGLILAPSVIYNEKDGTAFAFRLLAYPTSEVHYRLIASQSTGTNTEYEFFYDNQSLGARDWSYGCLLNYNSDYFPRFYGFGNNSNKDDETSYTSRTREALGHLGYQFTERLELRWQERLTMTTLSDKHLPSLPATVALFPDVMQNRRNTSFVHRLTLNYDTRDLPDTPTCGLLASVYGETASKALGSDASFDRVGIILKGFQPWDADHRFVTAIRLEGEFLLRQEDTPFYEWPHLGGFFSNRGYGEWRFIDRNMVALSLEQRIEVFRLSHFGVISHWEAAPFFDLGKVFPTLGKFDLRSLKASGGLALRASVRPQVVGHVEFGFGEEGSAVFMGLDYPF